MGIHNLMGEPYKWTKIQFDMSVIVKYKVKEEEQWPIPGEVK